MKPLGTFAILILLLIAQGCTSNDKDTAGIKGNVTTPAAATEVAVTGNVPPVAPRLNPAANGGSGLPAIAPYGTPNGPAVQQNINPAPFMMAAGGQGAAPPHPGAGLITSGGLTSRADGTMSGPNDQPAATTGWGTPGPQANPAATSAKPAAEPSKAPPK